MKDWKKELITPEQAEKMLRTPEGKKEYLLYIIRSRIAYAVQDFLQCCEVPPTPKNQEKACMILYNAMTRVPTWQILEYVNSIADHFNEEEDVSGHA